MADNPDRTKITRVIQSAFKSGALNPKMTVEEAVNLGAGLEEVAGYVLAWERYVLVVKSEAISEITMRRA